MPTSEGDKQLGFPFTPRLENNGSEFLLGMLGGVCHGGPMGYFNIVKEIMIK